jgi:hypothetical protein
VTVHGRWIRNYTDSLLSDKPVVAQLVKKPGTLPSAVFNDAVTTGNVFHREVE